MKLPMFSLPRAFRLSRPARFSSRSVVEAVSAVLLGRHLEEDEISAYLVRLQNGEPLDQLVTSILSSDECMKALTRLHAASAHGERELEMVIKLMYAQLFDRGITQPEIDHWYRLRKSGFSFEDIEVSLKDSEEGIRRREQKALALVHAASAHGERELEIVIRLMYAQIFDRGITQSELDHWYRLRKSGFSFEAIEASLRNSEEGIERRKQYDGISLARYIQLAYELVAERGAAVWEIEAHRNNIERGRQTRERLITSLFNERVLRRTESNENDPGLARLFGTSQTLDIKSWKERKTDLKAGAPGYSSRFSRFPFVGSRRPLVSIITSLYKGGLYIQPFLDNITSQTIFRDYCELLIVDADSPEGEEIVIKRFAQSFSNIKYMRMNYRIGIYDAWNVAVGDAKGIFCTNANLDDVRRKNSLEVQASALEALSFVDVVYQDVLYSFEPNLSFEEIEKFGFKTDFPIVSLYNLMQFNMPHNAPMWRKRLHDELGTFNSRYSSAGDVDFWLRCVIAGKCFYKLNDPHVAYYVNPTGISTRPDTAGARESRAISKALFPQMVSEHMAMDDKDFTALMGSPRDPIAPHSSRYDLAQKALRDYARAKRMA